MGSAKDGKAKLNRLTVDASRQVQVAWIWACGATVLVAAGCSSGSSDVVDSGNPTSSSSSSSSSGASSSSSSGSSSSGSGSGSSSSSGGSSSSGSSSGSSSSSSGAGGDAGETILFPFSQATDVPGGGVSMCPNNMKGCWFWDEYNPACSIPLGGSEAGAGGNEAGAEAGAEAAAGDGANPCPYPNVQPILSYDPAVGDNLAGGDMGSMKVEIPFTAYNQQALVQWIFTGTPLDLSTKTLFARLRFDSGGNPNLMSNPNGFRLVVKTGTGYVYGPSAYFNLNQNNQTSFTEFDFPLTATPTGANPGWDATQVIAIELEFDTGTPAATVDAGAGPTMATFHIDTIGTVP